MNRTAWEILGTAQHRVWLVDSILVTICELCEQEAEFSRSESNRAADRAQAARLRLTQAAAAQAGASQAFVEVLAQSAVQLEEYAGSFRRLRNNASSLKFG